MENQMMDKMNKKTTKIELDLQKAKIMMMECNLISLMISWKASLMMLLKEEFVFILVDCSCLKVGQFKTVRGADVAIITAINFVRVTIIIITIIKFEYAEKTTGVTMFKKAVLCIVNCEPAVFVAHDLICLSQFQVLLIQADSFPLRLKYASFSQYPSAEVYCKGELDDDEDVKTDNKEDYEEFVEFKDVFYFDLLINPNQLICQEVGDKPGIQLEASLLSLIILFKLLLLYSIAI
ncbi:MAG: hypothetical protein EZS28_008209 [Streblomastix strix]|uniref:Uncharacterized protein n=1 Tax=Streblomastix strix TaxID=222440 RepID=A0A5J4WMG5_9EUKA|nr:MAG: hypothetical protein EZS28_008209 [Streblomastix strix]